MHTETQQPRMSRLRLIKNLGVISFSFVLLFTGYDGLSFLQSTMNEENAVGVIAQALIYLSFCISTLLFSKYVIQKIGCKYSIVVSQIFYVPYVASNFSPQWWTMVPTALLLGAAAGTLWGAQSVYFNKASALYCSLGKKRSSVQKNGNSMNLIQTGSPSSRKSYDIVSSYSSREQVLTVSHVYLGDSPNLHTMGNKNNCAFKTEVDFGKNESGDDEKDGDREDDRRGIVNSLEIANALFFGTHLFLFNTAQIWSNLMSYYVLKIGMTQISTDMPCSCGANFCNSDIQCIKNNLQVPDDSRYLLSGLCVGFMVLGIILLVLMLEPIEESKESVGFSLEVFSATIKKLKTKKQIFLAPLSFLIGTLEGFYTVDITRAYIGCAWGTYNIGLVTIYYGIFSAVSSSISGWFMKWTGRVPVVSFGVASNIVTCVLLLLWTPSSSQSYVFYVIASLFGISIGVLWSQTIAFYGVIFREDGDAAFAGFLTWNSLGWVLTLAVTNYLCTCIKIFALVFLSFIGLLGYLMTERTLLTMDNKSVG